MKFPAELDLSEGLFEGGYLMRIKFSTGEFTTEQMFYEVIFCGRNFQIGLGKDFSKIFSTVEGISRMN